MTNKNISGLTAATTPLAGTELVPVWDGATKKVAVADLTAGRAVSVSKVLAADGTQALPSYSFTSDPATGLFYGSGYLQVSVSNTVYAIIGSANIYLERPTSVTGNVSSTGNFVPTTAAKGINFTANTPAAGMTSQLLNWYEEGTWTPALLFDGDMTGAFTYTIQTGTYTRIGRLVTARFSMTWTAIPTAGTVMVMNLPITAVTAANVQGFISEQGGITNTGTYAITGGDGLTVSSYVATQCAIATVKSGAAFADPLQKSALTAASGSLKGVIIYEV